MKPLGLLTLTLLASSIASASVIFTAGNNPQIDSAVLYNCGLPVCNNGPGLTVSGHMQQVVPDTQVVFTSQESINVTAPGYNAVSGTSSSVGFDDMAITIPGHTFTSIILQLTSLASASDGTVTFTAQTLADGPFTSSVFFDGHTGGNYFTITTNSGTQITELDLLTTQFQDNISQVRIGGISAATLVPEPATYGMIGIALLGLSLLHRRRGAPRA